MIMPALLVSCNKTKELYAQGAYDTGDFEQNYYLEYNNIDKVEVKDLSLEYGKWLVVDKDPSKKLAIIGVGPLLRDLQKELKDANIKCTLINALYLNPIDVDCLKSLLDYEQIVIYDPYSTRLGFVNQVMAQLFTLKFKGAVSAYFVENEFVKQATINEQLEKYHLLPSQIVADIKK